jgi:hypothetical protein
MDSGGECGVPFVSRCKCRDGEDVDAAAAAAAATAAIVSGGDAAVASSC